MSKLPKVKAEHQKLVGLLQDMQVPTWMWEDIIMDFVVGLPRTRRQNNLLLVFLDLLVKFSNFIPNHSTHMTEDYARIFIDEIMSLHGISLSIISDRDAQLTSHFWRSFLKGFDTQVNLSTAFYHQMDGQAECTIQTLEDILRACVIDFKCNWYDHLP